MALRRSPQAFGPHGRQSAGQRLPAVRNRLRPVRPAAYRHVRRGRAHHHGAPGVPPPERYPDAAVLLLRRHGRAAQGARQRAQQGDAGGPSRQAADLGARSVQQRISELRRGQQCAAARLPRFLRLRVRVPVGDRLVQVGPLRQDADDDAAALRRGAGGHAADPGRGTPADLLGLPADLAQDRPGAAGPGGQDRRRRPAPSSIATRTARWSRRRSPGATSSCSGRPTGPAAGSRSTSITRCTARISFPRPN